MTIPTEPTDSHINLYAHKPLTLVPLLKSHLPRALPVLSTILETASSSSPSASSSTSKPSASRYDVVWATFPPDYFPGRENDPDHSRSHDGPEGIWAVVVRMQEGDSIHLRFYCSAEITPSTIGDINTENETEIEQKIQDFVKAVTECIVGIYGQEVTLGAISSRWNQVMRGVVDARELVECSVFLAPTGCRLREGYLDEGGIKGDTDEGMLADMGLKLDRARDGDIDMVSHLTLPATHHPISQSRTDCTHLNPHTPPHAIVSVPPRFQVISSLAELGTTNTQIQSTCDVPRPHAYYASRAHLSTVIRQADSRNEAVCWIVVHADGALGALYTLPAWRRKGLAEIVVRQNIRYRRTQLDDHEKHGEESIDIVGGEHEAKSQRNFCYVFKGNTASERLWVKLGWEEGWGVRWIVNRKVEEARGKVARFSHDDEEG